MEHSFDIEVAKDCGILEAILYKHIMFWIDKNKANNKHFYDGRYWTYNSVKAFTELFPYASSKMVRTALEKLEAKGYIVTGNYNSSSYDRTKWYALGDYPLPKLENPFAQKGKPIPDINTDTIYMPNHLSEDFEKFWKEYPRKVNKTKAFTEFKKIKPDTELLETMLKALEVQKQSEQWKRDNGQYIVYPERWLKNRRWEDIVDIEKAEERELYEWKG